MALFRMSVLIALMGIPLMGSNCDGVDKNPCAGLDQAACDAVVMTGDKKCLWGPEIKPSPARCPSSDLPYASDCYSWDGTQAGCEAKKAFGCRYIPEVKGTTPKCLLTDKCPAGNIWSEDQKRCYNEMDTICWNTPKDICSKIGCVLDPSGSCLSKSVSFCKSATSETSCQGLQNACKWDSNNSVCVAASCIDIQNETSCNNTWTCNWRPDRSMAGRQCQQISAHCPTIKNMTTCQAAVNCSWSQSQKCISTIDCLLYHDCGIL